MARENMASQPIAAVIVPTIGTKRTQNSVSRETEIKLWGKMITQVISASAQSVRKAGFSPLVIVVDNTQDGLPEQAKRILEKIDKQKAPFEVIHSPRAGWANSILAGGQHAANEKNADVIVSMADDFTTEAKNLNIVAGKVKGPNGADMVFAQRKYNAAFTFPRSQIFNEATVSRLATLANPAFQPKAGENFLPAIERARMEGKEIQTFTGITATKRETFLRVAEWITSKMKSTIDGAKNTGFEILMPLTANYLGKKVIGTPFPRRFEHFFNKNKRTKMDFNASRQKQLGEGINIVKGFLEATGQNAKLPLLESAAAQAQGKLPSLSEAWKPGSKARIIRSAQNMKRVQRKLARRLH